MICDYCGKEIGNSTTCGKELFYCHGEPESRVPHRGDTLCNDCGVLPGSFHHVGCWNERCPICGGRVSDCSCDITFEIQ